MHLADAFIQSDLHCIQVTVLLPFELQENIKLELRICSAIGFMLLS